MFSKLHAIIDHCCNLFSYQLITLHMISRTLPDLGRLGQESPPTVEPVDPSPENPNCHFANQYGGAHADGDYRVLTSRSHDRRSRAGLSVEDGVKRVFSTTRHSFPGTSGFVSIDTPVSIRNAA